MVDYKCSKMVEKLTILSKNEIYQPLFGVGVEDANEAADTYFDKLKTLLSTYENGDQSRYFRALCVFSRELSIEQYLDEYFKQQQDESVADKSIDNIITEQRLELKNEIETKLLIEYIIYLANNDAPKFNLFGTDDEFNANFEEAFNMIYTTCNFYEFKQLLRQTCFTPKLSTNTPPSCHASIGNMLQTVNKQAIEVGGSSKKSRKTSSKKNDKPAKPTKKKNP